MIALFFLDVFQIGSMLYYFYPDFFAKVGLIEERIV
jgi:hypothetical protein